MTTKPGSLTSWVGRMGHFGVYEGHSHGMFDVLKMSGPEARRQGHVDEEVIVDIVAWIEGDWPQRSCREIDDWYAGCHGG